MSDNISTQAILFAINSALRLGKSIQRAYANSLKSRQVVLPLPSFDSTPNAFTINRFFETDGARFVEEIEALKFLHRKNQIESLSRKEMSEYLEYYRNLFFIVTVGESDEDIKNSGLRTEDVVSLLKIRQWEQDPKFATTTLQLVAGAIVEIGIDYFNQVPGALRTDSTLGKALAHLLRALDTIPFSEEENFKKAISQKIIPRLFIAVTETLQELPRDVIRDEKLRLFVEATSRGISEDLYEKIGPEMTGAESDEAIHWGQMILSSMIRNAGEYVFSSPSRLLDLNRGQEQLIKSTGLTLLELLYAEDELKLDLKKVLHHQALELIVKNTFFIFSENPQLLAKDDRLRIIIRDVCLAISQSPAPLDDILPAILRIILEKTALHLEVLWKQDEEEPEHLLVTALQQLLLVLSERESGTFQLSGRQLLEIAGVLFEEILRHPNWINRHLEDKPLLQHMLKATFAALDRLPPEERIHFDVLELLLEINVRLIATHPALLEKIQLGEDEDEKVLIEQILDLVFDCIFKEDNRADSPLEKQERLEAILSYIIEVVLSRYPDRRGLLLVEYLLSHDKGLDLGRDEELLDQVTQVLLEFLEKYPDWLIEDEDIRSVVKEFIAILNEYGLLRWETFSELIILLLERLADHLEQIVIIEEEQPRYLVTMASRVILGSLTQKQEEHRHLKLNKGQFISLFQLLFNEVLNHPEWITRKMDQNSLLSDLIGVSFDALAKIPISERFSFDTLFDLFEINMKAIAENIRVLELIKWGEDEEEEVILKKVINLVFDFIYRSPQSASLYRTSRVLDLLRYLLDRIINKYPNHLGLQIIDFLLSEEPRPDLSGGLDESVLDLYIDPLLEILSEHPDVVSPNPDLQKIIAGVAETLDEYGLKEPGLLPRVLSLVLFHTKDRIDLFYDNGEEAVKNALLEALWQVLEALRGNTENGSRRPDFSADQIIEIVLYILEEVSENTSWVTEGKKVQQTLSTILDAFRYIPAHRRPSFSLIKLTIIKIFEAVRNHPGYLGELDVDEEEKNIVLRYILKRLFEAIYANISIKATQSILHQPSVMDAILDYYLYRTSFHPITAATINEAAQKIGEAVKGLDEGRLTDAEAFLDQIRDTMV